MPACLTYILNPTKKIYIEEKESRELRIKVGYVFDRSLQIFSPFSFSSSRLKLNGWSTPILVLLEFFQEESFCVILAILFYLIECNCGAVLKQSWRGKQTARRILLLSCFLITVSFSFWFYPDGSQISWIEIHKWLLRKIFVVIENQLTSHPTRNNDSLNVVFLIVGSILDTWLADGDEFLVGYIWNKFRLEKYFTWSSHCKQIIIIIVSKFLDMYEHWISI